MKKIRTIALAAALFLALAPAVSAQDAEYAVNAAAETIVIDGTVEAGEWGDPVFTTTPGECQQKQADGWDYWSFTPAPANQSFELYVANDADYVYVAGKLIGADRDMACTDIADMWRHPHLTFTLAPYDPDLVCPVILFQDDYYEQYACYAIGFVNGSPAQACTSQGMSTYDLAADQYGASYDDASRTYHYECKIPMTYTNLDIWNTNMVVMGLDITDAQKGEAGNRYLVSQAGERGMAWMGPNVFSHQKTNPLIIALNDADSLRGQRFYPIDEQELALKKAEAEYAANSPGMTIAAVCAAVAAVCAAAAAAVTVIHAKKTKEENTK